MTINALHALILLTGLTSLNAFNNRSFLERMMFVPYVCRRDRAYERFITHMLIHADWGHLLFNMMSLYFLGDVLLSENFIVQNSEVTPLGLQAEYGTLVGQVHFLLIYVLGGLFATIIPYARNKDNPGYRSLGASGGVSAIIFASIMWNPWLELYVMFIPIGIPAYIFGPLYLAYEFYMDKRGGSNTAHDAHIGG
ncbi:MAG: rhomboid family intramembrane serine protease, partial [Crocinitomicaceae bacterium]|nr:rhomboid family intramembrane serine protease [Crocinitomicaceae bacterium]